MSRPAAHALTVPCRFNYTGTGSGLFAELIVGGVLTVCTFGLYSPWFVCRLIEFVAKHTTLIDSERNSVRFHFNGTGADLFVQLVVGAVLTFCTFGIYAFWLSTNLTRFILENLRARDSFGEPVEIAFNGTGADLFGQCIIDYVLTVITFGIYAPWMICNLHRFFYDNTRIYTSNSELRLSFHGTGGDLFGTFVVGYILTFCTLGLYSFWLQVQLIRFTTGNTIVTTPGGRRYAVRFTGTGWEYFLINVVGVIL